MGPLVGNDSVIGQECNDLGVFSCQKVVGNSIGNYYIRKLAIPEGIDVGYCGWSGQGAKK